MKEPNLFAYLLLSKRIAIRRFMPHFLTTCSLFFILYGAKRHSLAAEGLEKTYYTTSFTEITDGSIGFKIPFNFIFPKDYSAIKASGEFRYHVMHNADIERINQNGGLFDLQKIEYPFYYIEASTRYFYADQKFSIESQKGKFLIERMDRENLPILKVDTDAQDASSPKLILIHPNYETWVLTLHFFGAKKHSKFSGEFWDKILAYLSNRHSTLEKSKIVQRVFSPIFPDAKDFPKDIFRRKSTPMKFPESLPALNKTTEKELYEMYPGEAINRRYSLKKPRKWLKGKKSFQFDTYIEYDIQTKYKVIEKPGFRTTEKLEDSDFVVYLYRGIVVEFNLIRRRWSGEYQEEPKVEKISGEAIEGNLRDLEIDYFRTRSSLFRRVEAKRWFYEDYLAQSDQELGEIKKLHLQYLEEFPKDLRRFKNLRDLSLYDNKLLSIDCKGLKGMEKLERLDLSHNKITEIPSCIEQLTDLRVLTLDGNPLKKLPPSILNLPNLRSLSLKNTGLSDLGESQPSFHQLNSLNLAENRITKIPNAWATLQNLSSIDFSKNKAPGPPKNLEIFTNLSSISLEETQIEEFPTQFLSLENLNQLTLTRNKITELPVELCKERKVKLFKPTIWLHENPIDAQNLEKIQKCAKSYTINASSTK